MKTASHSDFKTMETQQIAIEADIKAQLGTLQETLNMIDALKQNGKLPAEAEAKLQSAFREAQDLLKKAESSAHDNLSKIHVSRKNIQRI